MKFIFTTICDIEGTKITVEFDADTWQESVGKLTTLLKASGYTIDNGSIITVKEEIACDPSFYL
jgi:predicted phosphohydrolase